MNTCRTQSRRRGTILLCAAGALLSSSVALAAGRGSPSDAPSRSLSDRAACDSAQSREARATCLREAAAAREEARRGRLYDGQASHYQQNALIRCKALPPADRDACVARMQGDGTTSGSVASGGIFREYVVRETPPDGSTSDGSVSGGSVSGGPVSGGPVSGGPVSGGSTRSGDPSGRGNGPGR